MYSRLSLLAFNMVRKRLAEHALVVLSCQPLSGAADCDHGSRRIRVIRLQLRDAYILGAPLDIDARLLIDRSRYIVKLVDRYEPRLLRDRDLGY